MNPTIKFVAFVISVIVILFIALVYTANRFSMNADTDSEYPVTKKKHAVGMVFFYLSMAMLLASVVPSYCGNFKFGLALFVPSALYIGIYVIYVCTRKTEEETDVKTDSWGDYSSSEQYERDLNKLELFIVFVMVYMAEGFRYLADRFCPQKIK